ncbi:MAG: efflux RND transporter permease subunit [Proteobacteria bacterium]|nr:efflux RND transporter permease subunit [Pseudomonadota bacterium]
MGFKTILESNLRYRWLVIALFLALTVVGALQLPKLRFDFSPEAMLEFSDEEIAYQNAFDAKFSGNGNVFLVVFSSQQSLLTARALTDLRDLTNMLDAYGESVFSLTRVPSNDTNPLALLRGAQPMLGEGVITEEMVAAVLARVETSSLLRGNLISEDLRHALIMINLDAAHTEPDDFYPLFVRLSEQVRAWESSNGREIYDISYGGLPYIRAVTVNTMKHEQLLLWPIVGCLYILALWVLFRSFLQAVLPLACIGCVILWAIAIMVWRDLPVTMINNTLPLLILVIGVTNSIYIMMRILDEVKKGKTQRQALVDGVYRVAMATLLTTSTTAVGFGSLLVARSKILSSFGAITALAVMMIYVALVFFMPQIASFMKFKPKAGKAEALSASEAEASSTPKGIVDRVIAGVTMFSIRHKWLVTAGSIVALVICIVVGMHVVRFNSKVNDVFEPSHPISQTNALIEEKLGGILPLEIDILSPEKNFFGKVSSMQKVCDLQRKIADIEGVITTLSACNILEEAGLSFETPPDERQFLIRLAAIHKVQPGQLAAFMTEDRDNVRISVRIPDNGVIYAKKTIDEVQAVSSKMLEGTGMSPRLTGIAYNSTRGLDVFVRDLFNSLMTAFVVIFLVLFFAFRSFWSGLVSIVPNVLPLFMTLVLMHVYGYELNTTSVLVFTISIGLAVDNTIHIIQRFRQEYRFDVPVADAIRRAMLSSGRAIVFSNVMLCGGLAVLLLSDFEPISRVGTLTITTIVSALLVSVIVLPAELAILGHRMKLRRYRVKEKAALAGEVALGSDADRNEGGE